MGLLSKKPSSPTKGPAPESRVATDPQEVVRDARTRARRRLIGAALLLGVGIIAFPLLFETQPRPIAVDIPIEIPSREQVAPLASPGARPVRPAPAVVAPPPVEVPDVTAQAAAETPAPTAAPAAAPPKPEPRPEPKADAKVEAKPEVKPTPRPEPPSAKPEARAEPQPAPKAADAAADTGRFVVQIGAFAEASSAREARMKVEAMGLKTYTQVIESATGRRIRVRVGPYATKAEAEKAARRIKAGGLQAAVLVL
ncbi:MAG: SPOR domain-containing protein [Burkholderiales bacterium]|nr:SPOR domain-containing protein [Burkholderiales bacterium]